MKSSAPAAPADPTAPACSAQRLAQIDVGGAAVADVDAHRLPDADALADGDRAGLPVGAGDRPDEEVAALVLGTVLVDHDAEQHPGGDRLALVRGEAGDDLAEALDRGLEGELLDHVARARR